MSVSAPSSLLIFGAGYLGRAVGREGMKRGWAITATSRTAETRRSLSGEGFEAVDPEDRAGLQAAAARARAIVVTAQPQADGCPGLARLIPALTAAAAWPDWIGYVSTTAVYGDRAGGWVREDDALHAASLEGARRVRAEHDWLDAARGMGLTVQIFRLPGIYGPGRSALDRVRSGKARLARRPGQIINRIHVEDAARGLFASIERPRPGAVYNLADDEPAAPDRVLEWAAERLGLEPPPETDWTDPAAGDEMRRFYRDSKRVSNALAKAELGWRPLYPSWREGLEAMI